LSLESDIELLGRVPLLTGLSPDNLRLLAFSAVRRDLGPGEFLFRKGEPARSGFVVGFGVVELTDGEGDERRVLEKCHRGYLIGQTPLFVDCKRPTDAQAINECTLMEISRAMMTRMLTEYPDAASALHARLTEQLSGTIGELKRVREALLAIES
jgi:CRP-like cAMP-binding protein